MNTLASKLQYQFKDPGLLRQALTHRSAGSSNNERLEFLGDAVLGLLISELLYQHYPEASEGELSRLRASLVQQSTLAMLARSLELGEQLWLGTGEHKTGGADRDSILADAFEALLSALYLDGGLALCRDKIAEWFTPLFDDADNLRLGKDAKTTLQELMQANKQPLPEYSIKETRGEDHRQEFIVECRVALLPEPATGRGGSRKEAEQQAAALVLQRLDA